ncbi:MAG TPA: DNA polymerase III subunit gamma/tau [Chthoniobacterales bacterium]
MSSYQVFARKYRPKTFDDVIGQEHITQTLKNAVEQNRLAHAYLFVGPRGTGKTSTARILAKALNCIHGPTVTPCGECDSCVEIAQGTSLDVLEFDAASNTQVDKIREIIIDNVKFAPTKGTYKLYLVDEVHMLSTSSFNALLKTLEEPPAHVKFLFATTDPQKVPTTILSRCQRFDLKRISDVKIAAHLQFIAGKEKIELTPAAADVIARGADGGLRDAESMLDQLVAFCGNRIDEADVLKIFGFTSQETISSLCNSLLTGQTPEALGIIRQQADAGKDLMKVLTDLLGHLRNLLVFQVDPGSLDRELPDSVRAVLQAQVALVAPAKLLDLIQQLSGAENRMKWAANKTLQMEIAIIRAAQTLRQSTLDEVLQTLQALRDGTPVAVSPVQAAPPAVKAPPLAPPPPEPPKVLPSEPKTVEIPRASKAVEASTEFEPIAVPEPQPGKKAVSAAKPLEEFWPMVIRAVRSKRPLIQSIIESAVPELSGSVLTLAFTRDQEFAADSLKRPNNRAFLEGILTELRGEPTTVSTALREGLVAPEPIQIEEETAAEANPMDAFKNDPLIQQALELFKAEIQSVQPATR